MSKIKTILSIIFIFTIWGCVSSAYPILLWWSRECVLYLIIIIKPEVWIINHCLGLGHETMVCAVCLTMFLWQHCSDNGLAPIGRQAIWTNVGKLYGRIYASFGLNELTSFVQYFVAHLIINSIISYFNKMFRKMCWKRHQLNTYSTNEIQVF